MPVSPCALLIPSFAGGETEIFCSYTTKHRWNAVLFSALRAAFPRCYASCSAVFSMSNARVEQYIIRIGSGCFRQLPFRALRQSVAEYL